MDFKEFKEKCYGKTIDEIKEIILQQDILKPENDIEVFSSIDNVINRINNISKDIMSVYLFLKEDILFLNSLKLFTKITIIPNEEAIEDYNFSLGLAFKEIDSRFNMYFNLVENGLKMEEQSILKELVEVFNINTPNLEDIKQMKDELNNVFSNESPDKLQMIENILAFNDPTMLGIKEALTQTGLENATQKIIEKQQK